MSIIQTFGDFSLEEVNLEQNNVQRGRDEFKEVNFIFQIYYEKHDASSGV